ncbi:uncharacterized protein LOC144057346 [Vanacampus margaritifer]
MLVLSWLVWIFYCSPAVGGPVQHLSWSEGGNNPVVSHEAARSSFYQLPVFWHASQPLVAKELLKPAPRQSLIPSELTALLFPQPTQYQSTLQPARTRPVEVWCGSNEIVVRVDRFELRAWPHPALYSLGSCLPTSVSSHFLFFHYPLTDCASAAQVVPGGQLVYSYALYYTPPPQGYVIRALPFQMPIHCFYNRFHYSYQAGYTPQVQHTTFIKSLRTKLIFSLTVCNAQWEPLSPGDSFVLGEPVNFLAQTGSILPGERLFVDSCYATHSKEPNSMPRVDIITNYGCMTDSRREGSSSCFWSRSANMLKFSIDAFLFGDVSQVLYLHCSMSVGVTTSHVSKSCNYNQTTARWEELNAPLSTCSCCDSVCGDMQDSVKNMVSSSGWPARRKHGEGSSMKDSPFQSEEGEKRVEQEGERKHRARFKKLDTTSETKMDRMKTKEFVGARPSVFPNGGELRPRAAISMSRKTDNQGSIEKDLTAVSQRIEPTPDDILILDHSMQDEFESREDASFASNDWMSGSFSNDSSATPRGSSRNATSIAQNSSVVGDRCPAENVSTDLIPIAEPCLDTDTRNCLPSNATVKFGSANTSADHTHPIPTTTSDTTRLELRAGQESADSKAETDSSEFGDVSQSAQSVGGQLERIAQQTAYIYVDSEGLDGGDMLQDLQIKEWESEQSAKACADGSDCNSGIEESEALHHGQFAVVAKTQEVEDEYLGVTPSSEEVLDNSHHSAVVIVTSSMQERSHMSDGAWPLEQGVWSR